jgi:TrpR-related protein YerC/YecD
VEMAREDWRTPEAHSLVRAILTLRTEEELERFLRDICTLGELRDLAQRWSVARLLHEGLHYSDISRRTGASTATITRIASWLRHGEGGYALVLDRAGDEITVGVPAASDGSGPSPAAASRPDR